MQIGTVNTASSTVLTRSSPTRGRNTSAETVSHPLWKATKTTKPSGNNANSETTMAASVIHDSGIRPDARRDAMPAGTTVPA